MSSLDPSRIPYHVALIPDGNRRWAKKQALSVQKGHSQGADSLMEILRAGKNIGIKVMTFYTFSTENWNRSESEMGALFALIENYLENELSTMLKEGIRFHTIGEETALPESLQKMIQKAKKETVSCQEIDFVLALNYGARNEIVRACRKIGRALASGEIKEEEIDEKLMSRMLDTPLWKDPDLLIRTSGEARLSNFLLWQLSYTEIYLTPTLWPDFTPKELIDAVIDFQKRDRRCGGD